MKIIDEFKAFALRGNMIDMAVGIIIGGAFGKIITSLVNDIIMPPLGLIIGGINFKDLSYVLRQSILDADGKIIQPALTFNYGSFLQNVFDFLLIALAIFMAIKAMNKLRMNQDKPTTPPAPPQPTNEEKLLMEIRDLLKKGKE